MTDSEFHVLDYLVPHVIHTVSACKIDSSSVVSDTDCLPSTPLSTPASEMNIVYTHVSSAPSVAVQHVMNSDAALTFCVT